MLFDYKFNYFNYFKRLKVSANIFEPNIPKLLASKSRTTNLYKLADNSLTKIAPSA